MMKAGSHFQDATYFPVSPDCAFCGLNDPRNNFQQGRFAGTIASYNTECLSGLHFEVNIL
jgi:hypothetical protein